MSSRSRQHPPRCLVFFIGTELDFLAKLAVKAQDAHAAGDCAWSETLGRSQAFLRDHLLKWVRKFADTVAREYEDGFYAPFSRMVAGIAARDASVLADLL